MCAHGSPHAQGEGDSDPRAGRGRAIQIQALARWRRGRGLAISVLGSLAGVVIGALIVSWGLDHRGAPSPGGLTREETWPVEVRYELFDVSYVEANHPPSLALEPLDVWEVAVDDGWNPWARVVVKSHEVDDTGWVAPADGSARTGVGSPQGDPALAAHVMRYEDGQIFSLEPGETLEANPATPFATLRATRDPDLAWHQTPVEEPGPVPGPVFHPQQHELAVPGVRGLEEQDWWGPGSLREQVAAALGLDPQVLVVAISEEPICLSRDNPRQMQAEGEACAEREDADWIRWARVYHEPTGIPLFVHWMGPAIHEDTDEPLEITQLRVTHVEFGAQEEPAKRAVIDLPPAGQTAATWHPDTGIPLFVVHAADGTVSVVEAVNPHAQSGAARPISWCPHGHFFDPLAASRFAPDGSYLGGPAPSDLVRYETRPGPEPDTIELRRRLVPGDRERTPTEVSGTSMRWCDETTTAPVSHADLPGGGTRTLSQAFSAATEHWVLIEPWVYVATDGQQWACEEPATAWDEPPACVGIPVPFKGLYTSDRTDMWVWQAQPMWVITDGDDGDRLRRPPHLFPDRIPLDTPEEATPRREGTFTDGTLTVPAVNLYARG